MVQKIRIILWRKEEVQVKNIHSWNRKLWMSGILILGISFVLAGCSLGGGKPGGKSKLTRYDAQFFGMFDTVTSIIAYTKDEETFRAYAESFHNELNVYHQLYDIYTDYPGISNIKTINDNAGIMPVQVDEKIIDMHTGRREAMIRDRPSFLRRRNLRKQPGIRISQR